MRVAGDQRTAENHHRRARGRAEADEDFTFRCLCPSQAEIRQAPTLIDTDGDSVGDCGGGEGRHGRGRQDSDSGQRVHQEREDDHAQPADQNEQSHAQQDSHPVRLGGRCHADCACCRFATLVRTPLRAIRTGKTVAPSLATMPATRSRASGSVKKRTQPPPPAPHTLAPSAPARRVTVTSRSISGVEMPGALRLRWDHSWRSKRPASFQSARSKACAHGARDGRDHCEIALHCFRRRQRAPWSPPSC